MHRRINTLSKVVFATLIALFSFNAMAYMPSAPNSPNGYDEYRTPDGASCRSSVGGNVQVYAGGYGTNSSNDYYSSGDEKGVHLGVAISIGGGKRIDCSRLQEIDTRRAELELKKLEAEIKALEQTRQLQLLQTQGKLPPLVRE